MTRVYFGAFLDRINWRSRQKRGALERARSRQRMLESFSLGCSLLTIKIVTVHQANLNCQNGGRTDWGGEKVVDVGDKNKYLLR